MPSTFGNFCDIVLKIYRIVYSYREAVTTCCCCGALLARSIYIYYIYYRVGNVDLFLDMTSNYPDAYLSDVNAMVSCHANGSDVKFTISSTGSIDVNGI